jgi:hypothetical protein
MFTQFLGTAATVYGVLPRPKTLLQARQMSSAARRVKSRHFPPSHLNGRDATSTTKTRSRRPAASHPMSRATPSHDFPDPTQGDGAPPRRAQQAIKPTVPTCSSSRAWPRSEMDSISGVRRRSGSHRLGQSEPVVGIRGLVKRYSSHEAVAGIDLQVRRGEIRLSARTARENHDGWDPRRLPAAHEGQVSVLGRDPATAAAPGGTGWEGMQESGQARPVRPGVPGHMRRVLSAPRDIDETIALVGSPKTGARHQAPAANGVN